MNVTCLSNRADGCKMFIPGQTYRAYKFNERVIHVIDELGHERVILTDDLSFITRNLGWHGPVMHAYFMITPHQLNLLEGNNGKFISR